MKMLNQILTRDIMQRKVVSIRDDAFVSELARLLSEKNISGVPVLDADGRIKGVASTNDIVHHDAHSAAQCDDAPESRSYFHLSGWEDYMAKEEWLGMHLERTDNTTVASIMTPAIYSVSPETPICEVAAIMNTAKIHRVIVIQDNVLQGIVTTSDLIQVIAEKTEYAIQ